MKVGVPGVEKQLNSILHKYDKAVTTAASTGRSNDSWRLLLKAVIKYLSWRQHERGEVVVVSLIAVELQQLFHGATLWTKRAGAFMWTKSQKAATVTTTRIGANTTQVQTSANHATGL